MDIILVIIEMFYKNLERILNMSNGQIIDKTAMPKFGLVVKRVVRYFTIRNNKGNWKTLKEIGRTKTLFPDKIHVWRLFIPS